MHPKMKLKKVSELLAPKHPLSSHIGKMKKVSEWSSNMLPVAPQHPTKRVLEMSSLDVGLPPKDRPMPMLIPKKEKNVTKKKASDLPSTVFGVGQSSFIPLPSVMECLPPMTTMISNNGNKEDKKAIESPSAVLGIGQQDTQPSMNPLPSVMECLPPMPTPKHKGPASFRKNALQQKVDNLELHIQKLIECLTANPYFNSPAAQSLNPEHVEDYAASDEELHDEEEEEEEGDEEEGDVAE